MDTALHPPEPQEIFVANVAGVNVMTPTAVEYGWLVEGQFAYEISKGTGFTNQPIFGVTVLNRDGRIQQTDDGKPIGSLVDTLAEAHHLVSDLKAGYQGGTNEAD